MRRPGRLVAQIGIAKFEQILERSHCRFDAAHAGPIGPLARRGAAVFAGESLIGRLRRLGKSVADSLPVPALVEGGIEQSGQMLAERLQLGFRGFGAEGPRRRFAGRSGDFGHAPIWDESRAEGSAADIGFAPSAAPTSRRRSQSPRNTTPMKSST